MVKTRTSKADILAQIPAARAREARKRKVGQRAIAARYDHRCRNAALFADQLLEQLGDLRDD